MEDLEKSGITEIKFVSASFSCDKCNGAYQIGGLEYNTCTCMNKPIKIPKLEGRLAEILERWFEEIKEDPNKVVYWDDEPLTPQEDETLWKYIDMIQHICLSSNQSKEIKND